MRELSGGDDASGKKVKKVKEVAWSGRSGKEEKGEEEARRGSGEMVVVVVVGSLTGLEWKWKEEIKEHGLLKEAKELEEEGRKEWDGKGSGG